MVEVPVKLKLAEGSKIPVYATEGSVGADLHAHIDAPIVLKPMERKLIPTGVFIELPDGYEAQIRPRSGLALKHGISIVNAPATIDNDYRGEVSVLLINCGEKEFTIYPNMRIAQLVIAPVVKAKWELVSELSDTQRGEKGFGHSGV
jgi:dUTP pyrophosphatase